VRSSHLQLDAQRANVSATWYTWLEQGRGGAPSTDEPNLRRFPSYPTLKERAPMLWLFIFATMIAAAMTGGALAADAPTEN
jgi:hypothetical protein